MKIRVLCYEGYRSRETPRAFFVGERRIDVVQVVDRWLGEDHEYVKVDGSDGNGYILRLDPARDEWEITLFRRGQYRTPR